MDLPAPSFLSEISSFAQSELRRGLNLVETSYRVIVDSPSGAQKLIDSDASAGVLNMFFYRFEHSGFFPQGAANELWHVRARCLITAFSVPMIATNGLTIPAGEIDLRVLGSTMQYLHENPIMSDAADSVHLEVVPCNLTSEEINQIWASQHNVAYRPSLLYEFALLPVQPKIKAPQPTLVKSTKVIVNSTISPDLPTNVNSSFMAVDAGKDWAPYIAFIDTTSRAVQIRTVVIGSITNLKLWIAGEKGEQVSIVWLKLAQGKWTETISNFKRFIPEQTDAQLAGVITPKAAHLAVTVDIDLPEEAESYLLMVRRASGESSNPLLLHLRSIA